MSLPWMWLWSMARVRLFATLRARLVAWTLGAVCLGLVSAGLWMASASAWQKHLDHAFVRGLGLYEALRIGGPAPAGVTVTPMRPSELDRGNAPKTLAFASSNRPVRKTSLSIIAGPNTIYSGARLQLEIQTPGVKYPLADLESAPTRFPAERLGEVTRLLASVCGDPLILARFDRQDWVKIDGRAIWGCHAQPRDFRLLALAILGVGLVVLLSLVTDTAAHFSRFAEALRQRGRLNVQTALADQGPVELREVANALNEYLAGEKDRLEKRAMVLSGVSHDLGTPATRLRLRTALIDDEVLRSKLETDIDLMTGMIESVLTYTRSEMNAEDPRMISLSSLVEAIVADYQDLDKPVSLSVSETAHITRSRSVFARGGGDVALHLKDARHLLVKARPISLERAIINLIENALKYGRRANVSVEATSQTATVFVDDEGSNMSQDSLDRLMGPFQRGDNSAHIEGVGLGLTIVATIARQHGGKISFERRSKGMRAALTISRR